MSNKSRPPGPQPIDPRKLAALAKKNAAKSGANDRVPKNFGKKYDSVRSDEPKDQKSLEESDRRTRFFEEMRKRDF